MALRAAPAPRAVPPLRVSHAYAADEPARAAAIAATRPDGHAKCPIATVMLVTAPGIECGAASVRYLVFDPTRAAARGSEPVLVAAAVSPTESVVFGAASPTALARAARVARGSARVRVGDSALTPAARACACAWATGAVAGVAPTRAPAPRAAAVGALPPIPDVPRSMYLTLPTDLPLYEGELWATVLALVRWRVEALLRFPPPPDGSAAKQRRYARQVRVWQKRTFAHYDDEDRRRDELSYALLCIVAGYLSPRVAERLAKAENALLTARLRPAADAGDRVLAEALAASGMRALAESDAPPVARLSVHTAPGGGRRPTERRRGFGALVKALTAAARGAPVSTWYCVYDDAPESVRAAATAVRVPATGASALFVSEATLREVAPALAGVDTLRVDASLQHVWAVATAKARGAAPTRLWGVPFEHALQFVATRAAPLVAGQALLAHDQILPMMREAIGRRHAASRELAARDASYNNVPYFSHGCFDENLVRAVEHAVKASASEGWDVAVGDRGDVKTPFGKDAPAPPIDDLVRFMPLCLRRLDGILQREGRLKDRQRLSYIPGLLRLGVTPDAVLDRLAAAATRRRIPPSEQAARLPDYKRHVDDWVAYRGGKRERAPGYACGTQVAHGRADDCAGCPFALRQASPQDRAALMAGDSLSQRHVLDIEDLVMAGAAQSACALHLKLAFSVPFDPEPTRNVQGFVRQSTYKARQAARVVKA